MGGNPGCGGRRRVVPQFGDCDIFLVNGPEASQLCLYIILSPAFSNGFPSMCLSVCKAQLKLTISSILFSS